MNKARKLLLQSFNDIMESYNRLDFNLILLLVDIHKLEFSIVVLHFSFTHSDKLYLIFLHFVPGDISKFSIFSNFIWRSSTEWLTIDIYTGLLSQIEPDNLAILRINSTTNFLQSLFKSISSGLTTQVDFVARNSSEIRTSRNWFW